MARFGFIHDKLDIKFLVLYLLSRTEGPIDFATLTDLSMCDEGVDYFLFAEAVSEMVKSEHLTVQDERYSITEKGRKNGAVCEESIPYSVRRKCDQNLTLLNARLRREAQVRTEILPREDGSQTVRLILDDNRDNLMTLDLYAPTQEQADRLTASFQSSPERLYRIVLNTLTGDDLSQDQS